MPRPRKATKTSPAQILAQEKHRRALELRKYGMTYRQIADELGYAEDTVANIVRELVKQIPHEDVDALRSIQLERLNTMLLSMWGKVSGGDERAIMTALAVMDKMDRYTGTELAQKHEVAGTIGVLQIPVDAEQYVEGLKRMAGVVEAQTHELPPPGLVASDKLQPLKTPLPPDLPASNGHTDPAEINTDDDTQPLCGRYVNPGLTDQPDPPCRRCGYPRSDHG